MTVKSEPETRSGLNYLHGFGSELASEALLGALPTEQNSPQQCPYGLYAEQFSGTAFTMPRHVNRRSWLYRIRPSARHEPFERIDNGKLINGFSDAEASPNQFRWSPLPLPDQPTDFLQGLVTMAGNADIAIHLYAANESMGRRVFYDADAQMLIVPQQGRLRVVTEFGLIDVEPQEIVLIPRGIRFRIDLPEGSARGYVCENFGADLRLPDLGVIGSNGLAAARHFEVPVAWYEDVEGEHELIAKFRGNLWRAKMDHSPFDVVAWQGSHVPCKYDLRRYNTIGSISYDHPDPCIFLVLGAPSAVPGVDTLDFVIFPPRTLVMAHTFRPPWFHRNIASEFMGLIHGVYDAKAEGFAPGGASLHNSFTGHGPDAETFEVASTRNLDEPDYIKDTMAFMFETSTPLIPTPYALQSPQLQRDYAQCWHGLKKYFNPNRK